MKYIRSKLSKRNKTERGQAMILIVFSIIGLLGMTALAIDGGNAYVDRRKAETAAAAAALTASITRIQGGDWRAAALATAQTNGYDNNGTTNTVELNTPPLNGPYVGNSEYIEVIITSHINTYFGPVIGVPQVTSTAHAVSQSKPAEYGQMFDGYALVSLAPHSDCQTKRSFWIHGEATISMEGGGIFINSDNPECAFIQFGSGSVRFEDDSPFTVVGGAQVQKPTLITPFPMQTGAPPISYPPAFKMPKLGCGSNMAKVDELDGTKMSSGNWDEDVFPPEGVSFLKSGIYCINGDFIVNDGQMLHGTSVLLIIESGKVKISGNAQVNLSAHKSADAQGLLIYMPIDNKNIMALNGDDKSSFVGTILAPGANIRLNGLDSTFGSAYHSQIIGYYIEVDGNSDIHIKYKDEQNYDAFKMPEVILSQ